MEIAETQQAEAHYHFVCTLSLCVLHSMFITTTRCVAHFVYCLESVNACISRRLNHQLYLNMLNINVWYALKMFSCSRWAKSIAHGIYYCCCFCFIKVFAAHQNILFLQYFDKHKHHINTYSYTIHTHITYRKCNVATCLSVFAYVLMLTECDSVWFCNTLKSHHLKICHCTHTHTMYTHIQILFSN